MVKIVEFLGNGIQISAECVTATPDIKLLIYFEVSDGHS